jgi:Cu+-exporting ATPase
VVPGAKIPTDGVVVFGSTSVDESLVTGEPLGVKKTLDDSVIGGTVNGNGLIHIKATRVGADTTLAQIVRLVNEAQTGKAPIQAIADRIAGYFVPGVIILGILTLVGWLLLLGCMSHITAGWSFPDNMIPTDFISDFVIALNFAISVIVVACPCGI